MIGMITLRSVQAAVLATAGIVGVGALVGTAVLAQESDQKAAVNPNDK